MFKVGEGRACWSLGNAHSAMGNSKQAYEYATRHLEIAKETGDRMGQATAQVQSGRLDKCLWEWVFRLASLLCIGLMENAKEQRSSVETDK